MLILKIDKLTNSIENVRTGDCIIMGLLKEPLDVDFFVDPKTLSEREVRLITDYIKSDKEKNKNLNPAKKSTRAHKAKSI